MRTHPLKFTDRLIVGLVTPLLYLLGWSLRIREVGRPELGPRARPKETPLWSLWHETILMSVWHHRWREVAVMISASRDGELIATIARLLGYEPVRGSSSKGGKEAAAELVDLLKAGKRCAITPDGPRGPRRQVKPGVAKIAALSGRPVVPFAFEAERCWRLGSWDKFIIPKPFSRAVFVYGDPIPIVSRGGDGRDLERIQEGMDRVTREAEAFFKGRT